MSYGFIIDTDSYSGNFEREMCAFMTGHTGDCEVGEEEQEIYLEDLESPIPNVMLVPDEHGCRRPVSIYPTTNVWNNGLGFHFKDGEEELALEKYKEYWIAYQTKNMEVVRGHRGKQIPTWTDEAIDRAIQDYEKSIEEVKRKTETSKYPAYQSVLVYFNQPLDPETIDFLKHRAHLFAGRKGIMIIGFRLYKENSAEIEI